MTTPEELQEALNNLTSRQQALYTEAYNNRLREAVEKAIQDVKNAEQAENEADYAAELNQLYKAPTKNKARIARLEELLGWNK